MPIPVTSFTRSTQQNVYPPEQTVPTVADVGDIINDVYVPGDHAIKVNADLYSTLQDEIDSHDTNQLLLALLKEVRELKVLIQLAVS